MLRLAIIPFLAVAFLPQEQSAPTSAAPVKVADFKKTIAPFAKKYCNSCHSGATPADGIDFTKFKTQADVDKEPRAWRKGGREVEHGQMPPAKAKQPTAAEKKVFMEWASQLKRNQ